MLDYAARAARCRTQNQFNRLHIDLETVVSPREVAAIRNAESWQDLPLQSRVWLRRLKTMAPGIMDRPQGYRRSVVSDLVMVYENPAVPASRKALLVAFTGNSGRLMIPMPAFLQSLDSGLWTVVALRKEADGSYFRGIEGIATDLPGIVGYVDATFSPARYQRVVTLGTSGGAYAAVAAAVLMGADRGVSVGGAPPALAAGTPGALPEIAGKARQLDGTDLVFVFGSDFDPDRQTAEALREATGGQIHPVADVAGHNVINAVLQRGDLEPFLAEVLASDRIRGTLRRRMRRLLTGWRR